jgi:ATP-binding protein involved in chromosome partitioning
VHGGGEQVAQQYQTQLLGSLPLDRTIREQGDNGNPELIAKNKPEIAEAYKKIAQQLLAELDQFAADSTPEIVFE